MLLNKNLVSIQYFHKGRDEMLRGKKEDQSKEYGDGESRQSSAHNAKDKTRQT